MYSSRRITLGLAVWALVAVAAHGQASLAPLVARVQPKIAKVYGAGGIAGLEGYQSGFLISADGHVLTAWSHVLDTDELVVTLNDGRRYEAKLIGADPRTDLAVLKIDATGLPFFDLEDHATADIGAHVLAFSNLFSIAMGNEAASVQHGRVSAVTPLAARESAFPILYRGPVYIVDAMTNNPGAAGGALTDLNGRLLGMLGKDVRSSVNNVWLNYAMPTDQLLPSVQAILDGKAPTAAANPERERPERPATLEALGIVLVPDVLARTPPFVDAVRPGSPAAAAGLAPDDLVVFLDERLIQSTKDLKAELEFVPLEAPVVLSVIRNLELKEFILHATPEP